VIRHSAAGAYLTGHDGTGTGGSEGNFKIQNNVWEDISGNWGGDGRLFEILNGTNGATFDRNTAFQTGWIAVFDEGASFNINFTNNIFMLGAGVAGDGTAPGTPTLSAYAGGGIFVDNVIIGSTSVPYPANTFFASSIAQVGFINYAAENFLLAPTSPYKGMATDGGNIGSTLQTSAQTGNPSPTIPTGWVNVISKNSQKCLDVSGMSTAYGATVWQWTCWGGDNQKFQFVLVSGGYQIVNKNSGLTLDVWGGAPNNASNGLPVKQSYWWAGPNQIFQLQTTSDGYFTIQPTNSGQCLDVAGASTSDGATVWQWSCTGGDNQKWSLNPTQ